ncbi:MAG TPA: arginine--tRNA ligase [bacterium]|nr:arginine--tRNA ligase [bacterium]
MKEVRERLAEALKKAVDRLPAELREGFSGQVAVVPSAKKEFGDFTSNLALKLARKNHPASEVAGFLKQALLEEHLDFLDRVEEKSGFLNFFLKKQTRAELIRTILTSPETFGSCSLGAGKKVLLEFVSANPTGPLTIAHGRQAAFGEALARILTFAGYQVTREYYHNDAGRQIRLLGQSLKARYEQLHGKDTPVPEDGYHGHYLIDLARKIKSVPEDQPDFFEKFAVEEISRSIREDLARFGVTFDSYISEQTFHQQGEVQATLRDLEKAGCLYQAEGATWFRSTSFGDDKDRVLVKGDGSLTYLAPDIAYHRYKIVRGYDLIIDILGPDHHGYVPRLKAAVAALGFPQEKIHIIIVQLTTLFRGQEKLRMSTRAGEFISLRQLMDEVGPDAAKFFFIFRRAESHLDFDLKLAKTQSLENPVYYLQYAHVRLLHLQQFAAQQGFSQQECLQADLSLLQEKEEESLIKQLGDFPGVIERISQTLEVHQLAEYLLALARFFHSWYQHHRVVNQQRALTLARLALVQALQVVFARAMQLLNISVPDRM